MSFRSGLVSLAGRSNVGKSTLLNAMVGKKLSIVTHKPQTTRYRVSGIRNSADAQIVFIDAPGLHRSSGKALNQMMNRTALQTISEGDLVLFVVEAFRWTEEDQDMLGHLQAQQTPVILVANKVDQVKPREKLLPLLQQLAERGEFAEVVPLSATRGHNLERLSDVIVSHLPEGPPLYPADMDSDRDDRFHVAELIREQLTLRLQQELPYGVAVSVEALDVGDELVRISAIVWVEREPQKAIVIGKGGQMLKGIGSAARRDLERHFGRKVHLELWAKVRNRWSDNIDDLARFGHDT
ncbi:MAG: GTPase Era [Gammaproteobacteria bacterium]|nr:GTPase Era [Gammaproteobacteria bacterium]NND61464.1 GTPase Era [Gammaproteobacteria bacterium]